MRVIAISNQKGGCGKTTISINLAASMAREGRRTLLLDLDPQSHCALGLSVPEEQIQFSTTDLLAGRKDVAFDRVVWQISGNFDLAPSRLDLHRLEAEFGGQPDGKRRLAGVLEGVRDRYDVVIVDTPPNVGFLTGNALLAADEVVVPVDTGYFSLHGLAKQLDTLEPINSLRERPLVVRILANLYDVRTKLAREILAELRRRHEAQLMATFINFNTKLKESVSFGQPISEYDPASSGCRDFQHLARELLSKAPAPAASVPQDLLKRAEDLAEKASALLATSKPLFGPSSARVEELVSETSAAAQSESKVPRSEETHIVAAERHESAATSDAPVKAAGASVAQAAPFANAGRADRPEALEVQSGRVGLPDERTAASDPRSDRIDAGGRALERTVPVTSERRVVDHQAIQRRIEMAYGVHETVEGVSFALRAPGAVSVRLAGDFNGWSAVATPLRQSGGGEGFSVILPLDPGRYRYRYVIDGVWRNDPHNPHMEANPFGQMDNVVEVTSSSPAVTAT
ncbi:MAG: AAA family ATPase [Phycisphaerae bacterium]